MAQQVVPITGLPPDPLAAASHFHANHLPELRKLLAGTCDSVVIVVQAANHEHEGWRRAIVRDLARAHAPVRVNMLASDEVDAVVAALAYLEHAPGVTGQLFDLDGQGAGDPA